jgi:hypothetical protein
MLDSTPIKRIRLFVPDTAHLAGLVADITSDSRERRRAAQRFLPDLLESGWLPLICWHHIEELLQHRDDQVVDERLRYFWGQPLIAWIRSAEPDAGPGSIVDVLRAEASAAIRSPSADAVQVRDHARAELIAVGPGTDAIPESFRDWRLLREALSAQQQNARRVAVIARWRATPIDDTPISAWIDHPARDLEASTRMLRKLHGSLAHEIATRGDRRIPDAASMATEFMRQVHRDGVAVVGDGVAKPAIQLLINAGLDPEDIDPSATFGETMDLLTFQKRLRVVADGLHLPWVELKRRVTRQQLPVMVIEEAMRRYSQDQPERKGSELNDTHMLCLAPYADQTFVDKRTLESARRARSKSPMFDRLAIGVGRASNCAELASVLTAQSRPL